MPIDSDDAVVERNIKRYDREKANEEYLKKLRKERDQRNAQDPTYAKRKRELT